MFKLLAPYPERDALRQMLDVSLDGEPSDTLAGVTDPAAVLEVARTCRATLLAERCKQAAVDLVLATQPDSPGAAAAARRHLRYGASPRALQSLVRAARVRAVMAGRSHVDVADLEAVARPVLRHRVLLRLESELEGLHADAVLGEVIEEWRTRE
jgi:MoxR-like ATPase